LPDGFVAEGSVEDMFLREKNGNEIWIALLENRLNYEIQTNAWRRIERGALGQ
jgi:hypothetical protein